MAARKVLSFDSEGEPEVVPATDTLDTLAGASFTGNVNMNSSGKVTNLAAATTAGDALSYGQTGANLNGLDVNSQKLTNVADGTANSDGVNYGQLLAAGGGMFWKDPAAVLRIKSDATQAGAPPSAGSSGEAWVVDTWGGGYTDGDIVEWDGSVWNIVVANSGGFPPNGTRAVVVETGAAGSFATQEDDVGTADGAGAWTFDTPSNGWALLVNGNNSIYENDQWAYDSTPGGWVQINATGQITAGVGLEKTTGNTLNVKLGDGITELPSDYVGVELTASNPGLELTGSSPNKTLRVLASGTEGIVLTATGVAIEIDDTPDTLDVDADGLKVVGVPLQFKINDAATSVNVTAANLNTLTAGAASDASSLHKHTSVADATRVVAVLTTSAPVAIGDPVYWSGVNTVAPADVTPDANARVIGVAITADAVGGGTVSVVKLGLAASVGSFAANDPVYLANGGGLTTTLPTGGRRVRVGYALNTTDLDVRIEVLFGSA